MNNRITTTVGAVSALLAISGTASNAMQMEYQAAFSDFPPSVLIWGGVELDDDQRLLSVLEAHPDVERVVVDNSPGGYLWGGIKLARVIYDRELEVDLQGSMASAATVISLGARNKLTYFEGGAAGAIATDLLFHCAYITAEAGCNVDATRDSAVVLEQLTGRPWEEWFDVLMETTPKTVESIPLEEILSYQDWECKFEYGYQICTRDEDQMFNYRRSPMRQYIELSKLFDENYEMWAQFNGKSERATFYPNLTRSGITRAASCNPTISGIFAYADGDQDEFYVPIDFAANGARSGHWEDLIDGGFTESETWFYSARAGAKPLVEFKVTPQKDPMIGEVSVTRMAFYSSHQPDADLFIPLPGQDTEALQKAFEKLRDACY